MTTIMLKTISAEATAIPGEAIERLRSSLKGNCALAGEPGYDAARTIWNAMVDRKPSIAIRAADPGDVQQAVALARDYNAVLSVRAGGHQIAGHAVCDGAILLDLSQMKSVRVDPDARCAHV